MNAVLRHEAHNPEKWEVILSRSFVQKAERIILKNSDCCISYPFPYLPNLKSIQFSPNPNQTYPVISKQKLPKLEEIHFIPPRFDISTFSRTLTSLTIQCLYLRDLISTIEHTIFPQLKNVRILSEWGYFEITKLQTIVKAIPTLENLEFLVYYDHSPYKDLKIVSANPKFKLTLLKWV